MGDEEEVAQTVQKALIFGSASFIGAALMETMEASGYAVEAGHAGSDVLSADVIVCSAYGNDTVRSSARDSAVDSLLCNSSVARFWSRLNCRTPNDCCPSWPTQIWHSPNR